MKVSVTLAEVVELVRQKVNAEDGEDIEVEFIEQPISTVETWGIIPWDDDRIRSRDEELFTKLDPDVREAVGYTTIHDLNIYNVEKNFLSGQMSWGLFDKFVKTSREYFRSHFTWFHDAITAVEIDGDNVTAATAAGYLGCSDWQLKTLVKKGTLHYLPGTKMIAASELIGLHGGKYIDGHLKGFNMPEKQQGTPGILGKWPSSIR